MLPSDSACRPGRFASHGCPDSQLTPCLLRPCSCDLREVGTLWTGGAYIRIHPKTPDDRLIQLLSLIRPDALVVD